MLKYLKYLIQHDRCHGPAVLTTRPACCVRVRCLFLLPSRLSLPVVGVLCGMFISPDVLAVRIVWPGSVHSLESATPAAWLPLIDGADYNHRQHPYLTVWLSFSRCWIAELNALVRPWITLRKHCLLEDCLVITCVFFFTRNQERSCFHGSGATVRNWSCCFTIHTTDMSTVGFGRNCHGSHSAGTCILQCFTP